MPNTVSRLRRYRWAGYSVLTLAFVLGFLQRIAPGAVAGDLMSDFSIPASSLGALAALYFYVYTALQIPAGVVADTLGPRVTVSVAMLLATLGSVLFGLADDLGAATAGRLLVGVGVSFTFVGLMKFNTQWFEESRFGFISGLTLLIGNLGAVLATAPLAALLDWVTWRQVFVGMGIAGGALAAGIALLVRNRPADVGLPDMRTLAGLPAHAPAQRHWGRELYGAFANPAIWPGFIAMLGATGAVLAFAGLWAVPLMQDVHGLSRTAAAGYATAILLGSAIGSFGAGSLSDALGRRKPVAVASGLGTVGCWAVLLWAPWSPGVLAWLLFALLGLCAGGVTVIYALARDVAAPLYAGMSLSIVNTGLFLGAAVAQPLFGWAMDWGQAAEFVGERAAYGVADYGRGLAVSMALAMAAAVACALTRETYCRNVWLDVSAGECAVPVSRTDRA